MPALTWPTPLHPAKWANLGTKGVLQWISLAQLRIDPAYQRHILDTGRANIRRMVENFDWLLFGVLIVGKRPNGQFAIIDGQHRAVAAALHGGIDVVPCLVHVGGQADEARAFGAVNGLVTRIHALQSFRARVVAGDLVACELVQMCANAGVTIAPYPKAELLPGETLALNSLRVACARHTEVATVAGLKMLRAADPTRGIGAPPIIAAACVLQKEPDWRKRAIDIGKELAARGGIEPLRVKAISRKAQRGGAEWLNLSAVLADAIRMALATPHAMRQRMMAGR